MKEFNFTLVLVAILALGIGPLSIHAGNSAGKSVALNKKVEVMQLGKEKFQVVGLEADLIKKALKKKGLLNDLQIQPLVGGAILEGPADYQVLKSVIITEAKSGMLGGGPNIETMTRPGSCGGAGQPPCGDVGPNGEPLPKPTTKIQQMKPFHLKK